MINNLETYYLILVVVQLFHSQEEIWNNFEKKWPLWKMSRKFFVGFEIFFSILILSVYFFKDFPLRDILMLSFNIVMFANGVWHIMWAGIKKTYVPGLVTAPIIIVLFLMFYFNTYAK